MEVSRTYEALSPRSTAEDIQKRLARPPALQLHSSSTYCASHRQNLITSQNYTIIDAAMKKQCESSKRLEDYLDPILLSTIRAKLHRERKIHGAEMEKTAGSKVKDFDYFQWPGDQHIMKVSSAKMTRGFPRGSETEESNHDADHSSGVYSVGFGDAEDHEPFRCISFQGLEKTAKRFKH